MKALRWLVDELSAPPLSSKARTRFAGLLYIVVGTAKQKTEEERVKRAGWKTGTVGEFVGVPPEEAQLIQTKAALAVCLLRVRRNNDLSQTDVAKRIGSSQSRVAKAEGANASVSIAFLIKALLATGATMLKIGAVLATGDPDAEPEVIEHGVLMIRHGAPELTLT